MTTWKTIKARIDPLNLKKGHYRPGNPWGFPTIYKQDIHVKKLVPFGNKTFQGTAHFFLDDFKFERVWNTPKRYIKTLKKYKNGVLSPDFSLYVDYPLALQIYNVYRNRWCGRYWQDQGIKVIPTVGWSTPESYNFCFEGIEHNSTVAVSSIGVMQSKEALKLFRKGFKEMTLRIDPENILFYGKIPTRLVNKSTKTVNIKKFEDFATQRIQKWGEEDPDDKSAVHNITPSRMKQGCNCGNANYNKAV